MVSNQREIGHFSDAARIDDTNRRLLAELQDNARLSLAELGRRVGLSSPAVAERLQRLEEQGCITGYRTEVDPRALGYGLSAVVRVRPAARNCSAWRRSRAPAPRSSSAIASPARTASS
jgi:Lrp/AsnC family leucine-responsive transcriptional regulator